MQEGGSVLWEKVEQGEEAWQCGIGEREREAFLNMVGVVGLAEKVAFEQNPRGDEVAIECLGKEWSQQREHSVQRP